MSESAIIEKLNRAFCADLANEAQVVYILVEARKLLERQKTLESYPALKLCCDWAVHPKLCGLGAQDVLKLFDDYEIEYVKTRADITPSDFKPLHGFVTHSAFRDELIHSLGQHAIDVGRLRSPDYWRSFVRLYTEVIRDCPLEAREGKTTYVTHVTGLAWPNNQMVFPGKVVIEWTWWLKDGREKKTQETCALI